MTGALGELAVRRGFLSSGDLEECLAIQEGLGDLGFRFRLGKILLERFHLRRPDLASLLLEQALDRGRPAGSFGVAAEVVRFGRRENEALEAWIRRGSELPAPEVERLEEGVRWLGARGVVKGLAELAVESGRLSRERAQEVLRDLSPPTPQPPDDRRGRPRRIETARRDPPRPARDPDLLLAGRRFRLGRLAVERGYATERQVEEALVVQQLSQELGIRRRLGEILVARGTLTRGAVDRLLVLRARSLAGFAWPDLELDAADRRQIEALEARGDLGPAELGECLYVLRSMRELGFGPGLADVVAEKGYAPCAPAASAVQDVPSPLGTIAVREGRVTPEELEECLDIQADLAGRGAPISLARILTGRCGLTRADLLGLVQNGLEEAEAGLPFVEIPSGADGLLLRLLGEDERVSPRQHRECVEAHRALRARGVSISLADVYLERGFLSPEDVRALLDRAGEIDSLALRLLARDPSDVRDRDPGPWLAFESVAGRIEPDLLREGRRFRLGRIAVLEGLATPERIRDALLAQLRLRELGIAWRLGRILIERGVLGRRDLARLLALQRSNLAPVRWARIRPEDAVDPEDRRLGRFLADAAILDEDQVQESVHAQRVLRQLGLAESLATILVEKGFMDREVVDAMLERLRGPGPADPGGPTQPVRRACLEALARISMDRGGRLEPSPRPRKPRSERRFPRVSVAAVLLVAGAIAFPLRLGRGDPPAPRLADPGSSVLSGTVESLRVFERPDGGGEFEFVLETGTGPVLVFGRARVDDPFLVGLRSRAGTGRPISIRGRASEDPNGPPMRLPDGTWTKSYLELREWWE